jgi:hypothetical protein
MQPTNTQSGIAITMSPKAIKKFQTAVTKKPQITGLSVFGYSVGTSKDITDQKTPMIFGGTLDQYQASSYTMCVTFAEHLKAPENKNYPYIQMTPILRSDKPLPTTTLFLSTNDKQIGYASMEEFIETHKKIIYVQPINDINDTNEQLIAAQKGSISLINLTP